MGEPANDLFGRVTVVTVADVKAAIIEEFRRQSEESEGASMFYKATVRDATPGEHLFDGLFDLDLVAAAALRKAAGG